MAKVFFASDLHIGAHRCNIPAIHDFLDVVQAEADSLRLVGDTFELVWSNWKRILAEPQYSAIVRRFDELSSRIEVKLVFGNHDPPDRMAEVARHLMWVRFTSVDDYAGYLVMHGHEFDATAGLWDRLFGWAYPILRRLAWLEKRLYRTPFQEKGERQSYGGHVALVSRRAQQFADRHRLRGLLFGHTHYPLCEESKTSRFRLINTGDMVDSLTYAVCDNGLFKLRTL